MPMPDTAQSVLVLEDNPVQCALYEKILRAGGFEVITVTDPLDLVNNLESLPVPSAILLDIVMPGMDGVTVLQHLERDARWCAIPAVMMTATPTKDRVVAASQLPVPPEGFLAKPVNPGVMLSVLRSIIAGQEPTYLLRQLQRKRLSLKLTLAQATGELAATVRAGRDDEVTHEKALAEIRREIQPLKTASSQLWDAPAETRQALQQQILKLEEGSARHREALVRAAAQKKEVVRQRQEILYKQKQVKDLERNIEALVQLFKRNKATGNTGTHSMSESSDGSPATGGAGPDDGAAGMGQSTGTYGPA
jgi:CheY-like chemotaxis protein